MKRILLIVFLLFVKSQSWSQINKLDSLAQIIVKKGAKFNPNSIPNRDSLLKLFPTIKTTNRRIETMTDIFRFYGQLDPGAELYFERKILEIVRKNRDHAAEANILCQLGFTISANGNTQEGMKLILEAFKMAKQSGNLMAIGFCYDILGLASDNNSIKKTYHLKGLYYSHKSGASLAESYAYLNLLDLSLQEHKTDSAKIYLAKVLELAARKNLQKTFGDLLAYVAYFQTSLPNKIKYLKLALQLPFTKFSKEEAFNIPFEIANTYYSHGKTDSSLHYAKKAFQSALAGYYFYRIASAQLLMKLYKNYNIDSALKYTVIYYTAKDSIYNLKKAESAQAMAFTQQLKDQQAETQKLSDKARSKMYIMSLIIVFFIIMAFILWRNNRLSNIAKTKIEETLANLKATQTQLIQSEKMASLGELTAGIAHEIQNPLNFVNNFSEVSVELLAEMDEELDKGDIHEAKSISADIKQNLEKINHHGKRADAIVKGMLEHSRAGSGAKEPTDINKLADEYLRLSYHGLRAKDKSFNATLITNFDENLPLINVIPQDIGRVFLNLINNAFYAVNQKAKEADMDYQPEVSVTTLAENGKVIIKVKDNGIGIPDAIKDKIMQPFFTTKPTGEGTGLGLSLTYDMVVKGHGGKIEVNSTVGEGSEFMIQLPIA